MPQPKVITKKPEERCAYFLRISKHYQNQSDNKLASDYASLGLDMARKYNLQEYCQSFEEILHPSEK